jgi:hypothetical protein
MHTHRILSLFILAAASILFGGCSSIINSHYQKEPMLADYLRGDSGAVSEFITDKLESTSGSGDELMWVLEAGSMKFFTANYPASIDYFRKAEELIAEYDERATVSLRDGGSEAIMAMTNLNALPYRGFCRDRIMLSFYKALAYLGENNEEAFRSQLRRLRDEQKKVMEDYQKFFEAEQEAIRQARAKDPELAQTINQTNEQSISSNVDNSEFSERLKNTREIANRGYGDFLNPAALFLSGIGSVREGYYDNAVIDFRRLYEAMPDNPTARRYYVTALQWAGMPVPANLQSVQPFDFPLGADCVYVLFANGRSAAFQQVAIYFPVMTAWPVCEYYPAPYSGFQVNAGGFSGKSVPLADMDGILSQEYTQRLPGMITRIVISTALKEAAHYAGTWAAGQEDVGAGIAVFLAGLIYKIAFNTADTRSWELLPKEFQLVQFPMPANRRITITPDGREGRKKEITLPEKYRSAILYVHTPSEHVFDVNILGFTSK